MAFGVLAFLALAGVAFAQSKALDNVPQACIDVGLNCLTQCCSSVGGNMNGIDCDYPVSAEARLNACTNDQCRPQILDCMAPGSSCKAGYLACKSTCGGDASCADRCMGSGVDCAKAAKSSGPSCCGAIIVPALVAMFVASRRQ